MPGTATDAAVAIIALLAGGAEAPEARESAPPPPPATTTEPPATTTDPFDGIMMTPGFDTGSNSVGYSTVIPIGSITGEPVEGQTLLELSQFDAGGGIFGLRLAFVGDVHTLVASLTVDGITYTEDDADFVGKTDGTGGFTSWTWGPLPTDLPLTDGVDVVIAATLSAAAATTTEPFVTTTEPPPPTHTYWRVKFNGSNGDAGIELWQFQLLTAGVNQCTTSTGTASASSHFAGEDPIKTILPNTGNWASNFDGNFSNLWFEFAFNTPAAIDGLTLACATNGRSPSTFDVQYSDDDSAWTTLWSESSVAGFTSPMTFTP